MKNGKQATLVRILAWAAVISGIAAAFAGSPYSSRNGRIDVDALSKTVQHEDDHATALELAAWIRERRPGLRVIDVRTAPEYDAYHIPTAERVPLDSIAHVPFRKDETIVLYSEGGAHAAQAWVFLRALGYDRVLFLRGGLQDWLDDVMSPTLSPTASRRDTAAFESNAALSRYFGGVPHRGVPDATVQRVKRRGC